MLIQIGTLVTKVVSGVTIRGFFALAVMSAFVNRVFALPGKLASMGYIPITAETGLLGASSASPPCSAPKAPWRALKTVSW